jgi:purine-binding chemotaxis protein CheW
MKEGFMVFRLGSERYAVPLSCVRELGRIPNVTPVPRLPGFVAGVANLRGNVLGLIDLQAVVGAKAVSENNERARRMMVWHVNGVTAGVLVDAVEGVAEIDAEMDPPVPTLPETLRPFVRGHLQHGPSTIAVLEPELITALRERVEAEAG